jgi:hypothetical protein
MQDTREHTLNACNLFSVGMRLHAGYMPLASYDVADAR